MAFKLKRPPPLTSKHESYPYQLDAVRSIQHLPFSAIFHEQGLGKTKIAIDLILSWLIEDAIDTVFIVTKKILVPNWVEELQTHTFVTPKVLSGNRSQNSISLNSPTLIYVMNYEVVSTNFELFSDFLVTCRVGVFLDESQKIKNPNSNIAQSFLLLAEKFSRRVIITGTPVANRPYDIWAQVKFLDNGVSLGKCFSKFKTELDLPNRKSTPNDTYVHQLTSVMEKIQGFTVRETKETAGLELPNKKILTHFVDLSPIQSKIYSQYKTEMAYEVRRLEQTIFDDAEAILKRLLRFVQCASNPRLLDSSYTELPAKFLTLLDLLEEIDVWSTKVIVWTSFIDNVEWLADQLKRFRPKTIHGKMALNSRTASISSFKSDESCRILIATPGAAKEGLTLTVASHAIFFDRGFSLDDYVQAQDRIHRISQTERCYVHNLIARKTVDEWVDVLLNSKFLASQLIHGDISSSDIKIPIGENLNEILIEILSPVEE